MFGKCLENVKEKNPLVHCITNYVTVNGVANALLACGGSPVMADAIEEAADITAISDGLYINIGTLNQRTVEGMFAAGQAANDKKKLILLDPVGAGASRLRTKTALDLMEKLRIGILRGNISEIKAISGEIGKTKGVDADESDAVTEENLDFMTDFARKSAKALGVVLVITGKIDLVSDGDICYVIRNGCEMMKYVTGTGCMLSALSLAYGVSNPKNITEAVAASVCLMGLAGEKSHKNLKKTGGNMTFYSGIIDNIFNMTSGDLERGAKYEIR